MSKSMFKIFALCIIAFFIIKYTNEVAEVGQSQYIKAKSIVNQYNSKVKELDRMYDELLSE